MATRVQSLPSLLLDRYLELPMRTQAALAIGIGGLAGLAATLLIAG